jgi:protein SCO1/2
MIRSKSLLLAASALCFTGCSDHKPEPPLPEGAVAYEASGIVREISEDRTFARIRHEEIPGYMPKMTMRLNVRDPDELTNIAVDDTIQFRLVATDETHWIDRIARVAATVDSAPETETAPADEAASIELEVGDILPDHALLSEDGTTIQLSDFRGKALAFTFIFTRCPLPDFCPRMSNNFRDARKMLRAEKNAPTNWAFLSVSFDPENDTPEVLRAYGETCRNDDPDRWTFAAASKETLSSFAPEVDLLLSPDMSHNLRTVVLDTEGRIANQFDGNLWTPEDLANAVKDAAAAGRPDVSR